MSEEQNSPEEPINAGNKESPEVEAAVNDTGGPGDTPASEIEAADEAAAALRAMNGRVDGLLAVTSSCPASPPGITIRTSGTPARRSPPAEPPRSRSRT